MTKRLDLRTLEEEVQKYWAEQGIETLVEESKKGNKRFYFCQGPPFTSGQAHLGHAWNHTIKDTYLRFKSMQGYDIMKRAGWDMHGLPIEVKVEEEVLGSRSKKEIEEYGIENFIRECKKFAIQNMNKMTVQLKRLGVWLDWDDPYMTLDRRYMEGVWHGIKKAYEKDLLYEAEQVIHWCPRCETAMAGYEVKDEYRDITDTSIYVKARLAGEDANILIWTTTPWTLPANTGIAVHPDFDYVKVELEGEKLILAKERLQILGKEYRVIEEFKGRELEGKKYEPMLELGLQEGIKRKVVMAPDLVNLDDGTGCVHIAPGHGEEDFEVGRKNNLDSLSPVDEAGRFTMEPYLGVYIRDANRPIIKELEGKNRLYKEEAITHSYPHCWRCKTPLMLRTTKQWFLAVSKIREDLLRKNKEIDWIPDWIGTGRFENWLTNARDWCISRQRYWNTPLPVWKCGCGRIEVIGSIDELREKSSSEFDSETIDLHRPAVDEIRLKCSCGKEMVREKHVMDVWLDSGSASWANLWYPSRQDLFEEIYPADFITEGSDQTRGWFYSMLVCGAIAFDRISYRKVLYHGFVLDAEGRKMSKSLGNVVDPMDVVNKYGADVLRFYMLWASVLWEDLRFSWEGTENINKFFNILSNVHSFSKTYMEIDGFQPGKEQDKKYEIEDLWLLSKYNSMLEDSTKALEGLQLYDLCRCVNDFVLELSRWYVKLIRDRVWIEKDDPRKIAAYHTLYTVLKGLSTVMAPVTPHFSEYLYRDLTGETSVHLEKWPEADKGSIDKELEAEMKMAQDIVECVAAARQKAKIKLRWPIKRVIVAPREGIDLGKVEGIILKASNAKKLQVEKMETKTSMKINFPVLGPKVKGDMGKVGKALAGIDAAQAREKIESDGGLDVAGYTLTKEDLVFESELPEDIVSEEFTGGIVYIDSKLDAALYSEAMAREVIRRVQEMRKELSLEETKEIEAYIQCSESFLRYVKENKETIEKETRSKVSFGECEGFRREWRIEEESLDIMIKK